MTAPLPLPPSDTPRAAALAKMKAAMLGASDYSLRMYSGSPETWEAMAYFWGEQGRQVVSVTGKGPSPAAAVDALLAAWAAATAPLRDRCERQERLLATARAEERERCAKVADGYATIGHSRNAAGGSGPCPLVPLVAAAIRALPDAGQPEGEA